MGKLFYIIFIIIIVCSCGKTTKNNIEEIFKINNLSVGDNITGFAGMTDNDSYFDIMSLNRKELLIFFNNNDAICLINDEIFSNNIGKLAKEKNVDILFLSDMKIAKIYGIEYTDPPDYKMKYSVLFVVDSGKKIKKIYKNIKEENIVDLLKIY